MQEQATKQVISVTSGKGGVGKTLTSINIAMAIQSFGKKVLLLDGDLGLANVDVVLGLKPRYNVNDVLENRANLNEVIVEGPAGMLIIPSGSGIHQLTKLTYVQRLSLLDQIAMLDVDYDVLVIDTGAGISDNVLHFNSIADNVLLVTTPEPHAMADAYATVKVLNSKYSKLKINILVNLVKNPAEGLKVFEKLAEISERFIGKRLHYVGHVPVDPQLQRAVIARNAASERSSHTIAGQAWNQIARDLCGIVGKRVHDEVWRELIWANQANPVLNVV